MTDQETMDPEVDDPIETEAPPPKAPRHEARYLPPAVQPPHASQARAPILAALFSIFPGLGNVYNGLYLRGVTFFLICVGLIGLAAGTRPPEAVLLIFAVIFVWLFNLFDAYRQATLINYGYTPGLELADKPRPTLGSGGLVAGTAVFLLGFYGLLREVFEIDLTLLADYWYVLFMAFGAFLIVQTVLQKKRAAAGGDDELGI